MKNGHPPIEVRRGHYFGRAELFDSRGRPIRVQREPPTPGMANFRRHLTPLQRAAWRACVYVPVLLTFAWVPFVFWLTPDGPIMSLRGFVTCGLMFVSFSWTVAAMRLIDRMIKIPAIAAERLSRRLCASCEYPLELGPPDADGCAVCPECGAAWKLNDPTSERTSA